jgi:hypothetical protein
MATVKAHVAMIQHPLLQTIELIILAYRIAQTTAICISIVSKHVVIEKTVKNL